MKTPEPVLVTQSILAGLHMFFGGSAATSVIVEADPLLTAVFAFGNLAVGAAQVGVAFYVRGQVTPEPLVVERLNEAGQVVAGTANELVRPGVFVRERAPLDE